MGESKMAKTPAKSPKKSPKKTVKKATPTKGKAKKEKKDPKDKKPAQGFMLFSKVNRPDLKKKNPDWAFGEFGKELGKMWGKLDDKTKESWKTGGALYKKHSK